MTSNKPKVEIRGIYATALTKLLSQHFPVVRMSRTVSERFEEKTSYQYGEVSIKDRMDKQGVVIVGTVEGVESVVEVLKKTLPDMVAREKTLKGWFGYGCYIIDFPGLSKKTLDHARSEVTTTVKNHHKLRIFASQEVDKAEKELTMSPERKDEIESNLKKLVKYDVGDRLEMEHVKLSGEVLRFEGEIIGVSPEGFLKVRRNFKGGGLYDGLSIQKEEGDYGITELMEGSWIVKHTYYSNEGFMKGEFHNINTALEFYPGKARYVDLEVDVIKPVQGFPVIIDLELLENFEKEGYITRKLVEQAKNIAKELMTSLLKI